MTMPLQSRRLLLAGIGASGLSACAPRLAGTAAPALAPRPGFALPGLRPIALDPGRITHITVCLRPFRAAGPRQEVEMVGDKRVVHNYGHGGSGWSLSWGAARIATASALEGGVHDVAVIGCGAMGLTAALLLQRAGARVTIYAKERPWETRSARATGTWSPDSRLADAAAVAPGFPELWERMARDSFAMHQTLVGVSGDPVFWTDAYFLRDSAPVPQSPQAPGAIQFAHHGARVRDMMPRSRALAPAEHPFPVAEARVGPSLTFNIAELSRRLLADFLMEGGRIEPMTLNSPADLTRLKQPVIVNCTGYGARQLWQDDSIVPARGQIGWLPPEPDIRYSLFYRGVLLLPRPDGTVVQQVGDSEMFGVGNSDETPDRAETEAALSTLAPLFKS